jgi:acetylornithine/N-succinyldiaminopimelate aminotransferase
VLDRPEGDVVLVPALGYPTYVAGAALAGAHVHRIPVDVETGPDLASVPASVAARALCLWVNSPANPTGTVTALPAVAEWGRRHGVVVVSDETYSEFTWDHPIATVLAAGTDGVLALHSLAKRSHAPGLRVGFYAGDADLVAALADLRRTTGLIASESAQATGARLLANDTHVDGIRERTRWRLHGLVAALADAGLTPQPPAGGPFVWLSAPGGDGLGFAEWAARTAGLVVAPGSEYGPAGHGHVRLAAVRDPAEVAPRIAMLRTTPVPRTKNRSTP